MFEVIRFRPAGLVRAAGRSIASTSTRATA